VRALLLSAASRLRRAGIGDGQAEALLLLSHAAAAPKTALLAHPESRLGAADVERFKELVARRALREPFAYIVGQREFYGRTFAVDRRVLVPRPETELLVEEALAVIARSGATSRSPLLVADVGTGSGAIACTLALEASRIKLVACDTSAEALAVAALNRERYGLDERVSLVRGDLLSWTRGPVDVVVANLPYVPSGRLSDPQPEVSFEPRLALDGGPDGTDSARRLLRKAPRLLRAGGTVLLELDPPQIERLQNACPGATASVIHDLAGLPRVLRLDLPSPSGEGRVRASTHDQNHTPASSSLA
jgi:release factor glutamine methyltransferase